MHTAHHHIADPQQWGRRFYLLLALLFTWRLVYITVAPLDLVPDEAYYWDWSRQLAWGYYSKPPLIAWIDALSTRTLGARAFSLRLPAVVLGIVGLWALYALANRMYGDRVAFWAAAVAAASPGNSTLGFLMTIDVLLLCLWPLSLYALWRALEDRDGRWRWWIMCAITVGLGLLGKQTMTAFLVLIPLLLWVSPQNRPLLNRSKPYLLIVLALLALLPVVWWNAQHDWVTIRHTAHHFNGAEEGLLAALRTVPLFLSSQLLIISPLVWLLMAAVTISLLVVWRRQDRTVHFLLIFSVVPLLLVLLLSLRQKINANWPAAFYPTGMVPLAAWADGAVSAGRRLDRWRTYFVPGILIGAGLAVLAYALPFVLPASPWGGGPLDPTGRLKGWQSLGRQVAGVLERLPSHDRSFLLTTDRKVSGELAFYLPDHPQVFEVQNTEIVNDQYDLWPGPTEKIGWDGLLILKAGRVVPAEFASAFTAVEPLGELTIPLGRAGQRQYALYLGHSMIRWPR